MGELVDDAIVDVEHLPPAAQKTPPAAHPQHALRVVYEASREVRSAIVFGTLVVVLVFLPLFALSGVEGRLFAPAWLAYIVSILASLLVSVTVTPVASYYLLAELRAATRPPSATARSCGVLKFFTRPLIRVQHESPHSAVCAHLGRGRRGGLASYALGSGLPPPFDEGSVQVNVHASVRASSLEASNKMCRVVDCPACSRLQKTDEKPVSLVLPLLAGRAVRPDDTPNRSTAPNTS